ncbi:MAG: tryptophan synthase subunit alpha [Candidatus Omnitrophica bacterium]|nr:tryptophan synthase subunit alpha [Candidatus Omnitrophota bacterium]
MNRIDLRFKELKNMQKKAFIAFITAGYPNLDATEDLVLEFSRVGVDIIELGMPFSDPIADGPIIQEASQIALKNKINLDSIFGLVRKLRRTVDIPICVMSYYNPVFCFGEGRFLRKAKDAGIDGVIIPDLPAEESLNLKRQADKLCLDTIFFLSPTSSLERIKFISGLSRGFIYYVSLTGVTGMRQRLPDGLLHHIREIKRCTAKPICVGFGISGPAQVKQIYRVADGVIVGSAIIQKIKENTDRPDMPKRVANFVLSLKDG